MPPGAPVWRELRRTRHRRRVGQPAQTSRRPATGPPDRRDLVYLVRDSRRADEVDDAAELGPAQAGLVSSVLTSANVDWRFRACNRRVTMTAVRDRGRPLAIARGWHSAPPCPQIAASSSRTSGSWANESRPTQEQMCRTAIGSRSRARCCTLPLYAGRGSHPAGAQGPHGVRCERPCPVLSPPSVRGS